MMSYFPVFASSVVFVAAFFGRSTGPKARPVEVRDDFHELDGRAK